MPPSPFVIPTILVDDQALDLKIPILSIEVVREVNRIPRAHLVLGAPGTAEERKRLLGGGPFKPGAKVRIKVRQDDVEHDLFMGLVTGIGILADGGLPTLSVDLRDKAVKLTNQRRSKVWPGITDAEAIQEIIDKAGLTVEPVPTTQPKHTMLVQYDVSDWDFLLTRADALGLLVVVEDGTVSLRKMEVSGTASRSFALRSGDITSVEFELDAARQHPSLEGMGWDSAAAAPGAPETAELLALRQGGIGSRAVGAELGFEAATLRHMAPMLQPEAQGWASSCMARCRLALIRGRLSVPGLTSLKLLEIASLEDFGDSFDGDALITGLCHRIGKTGFRTDVQFGLSPEPSARLPDLQQAASGGLLPGVPGLQIGTVAPFEADPEHEQRIKVLVPAFGDGEDRQIWARVASPDAGDKRGFHFRPEPGDEVVIGFLNQDPRYPILLGRLHGSKNAIPPDLLDDTADNPKKGIVTRSGATILFNDAEKPSITIKTPAGTQILLDDNAGKLTLTDQHGNSIVMGQSGIEIVSCGKLAIEAADAITIKGPTTDISK